jgi:hypothetical protein
MNGVLQSEIERQIIQDGVVRLHSDGCTFVFRRLRPGVVLMQVSGDDKGQFGTAAQDEVALEFRRVTQPVTLFIDTTGALGPVTKVMESWAEWFEGNRKRLGHVAILIPREAKVLQLTVAIAKHLSGTGDLIAIHLDRGNFDAAILQAAPDFVAEQVRKTR